MIYTTGYNLMIEKAPDINKYYGESVYLKNAWRQKHDGGARGLSVRLTEYVAELKDRAGVFFTVMQGLLTARREAANTNEITRAQPWMWLQEIQNLQNFFAAYVHNQSLAATPIGFLPDKYVEKLQDAILVTSPSRSELCWGGGGV